MHKHVYDSDSHSKGQPSSDMSGQLEKGILLASHEEDGAKDQHASPELGRCLHYVLLALQLCAMHVPSRNHDYAVASFAMMHLIALQCCRHLSPIWTGKGNSANTC